jgi:hypothetical protein
MIRLATNHRRGGSAHNVISGYVSNGSTWSDSFVLRDQDGANVTGVDAHDYQMQFRSDEDDTSADLTITSTAGQITASEAGGVTTLTLAVAQSAISTMRGEYTADLVSKTGSTLTHRGHGKVTFTNAPVAF